MAKRSARVKVVPKVWGEERWLVNNRLYCGKLMILRKGWRCSFHMHKVKDETFFVRAGRMLFELEGPGGRVRRRVSERALGGAACQRFCFLAGGTLLGRCALARVVVAAGRNRGHHVGDEVVGDQRQVVRIGRGQAAAFRFGLRERGVVLVARLGEARRVDGFVAGQRLGVAL